MHGVGQCQLDKHLWPPTYCRRVISYCLGCALQLRGRHRRGQNLSRDLRNWLLCCGEGPGPNSLLLASLAGLWEDGRARSPLCGPLSQMKPSAPVGGSNPIGGSKIYYAAGTPHLLGRRLRRASLSKSPHQRNPFQPSIKTSTLWLGGRRHTKKKNNDPTRISIRRMPRTQPTGQSSTGHYLCGPPAVPHRTRARTHLQHLQVGLDVETS